ncbi:unnamed protein product [Cladocopium goreaui]|uniref:Gamma-interferon-inducible lysosomal thiol reductase n=1 Tax=Cladocopium goreaui TaxID=2562237 RepID=A0A9P1FXE9_9DINO|nr:unnamed protein product [Cladocopium goreaui]
MANRSESDLEGTVGMSRRKCQERSWDFARELRFLRDSCARSRTEEMQALRRSSEEVERCVLRRQLDESAVLQDFLAGLHEDIESQLAGLQAQVTRRLDLLEDRISKAESEGTRVTLGAAVTVEVQRAVSEAFLQVERSAEAAVARRSDQPESGPGPGLPSGGARRRASDRSDSRRSGSPEDDTLDSAEEEPSGLDWRLQRLALKLVAAGEESARAVASEVAVAVANATMPQLEERLMEEAQRQNEAVEMAREAAMLEAEVVKRAVSRAEAASADVQLLKPEVAERLKELEDQLLEVRDAAKQQLYSEFREAREESRKEERHSAELHQAALGRLEESLREALSRHYSEAIGHANEAYRHSEALEQSLMEETKRGQEDRVKCSESAQALASLGQDLEATKESFLQEQKELRLELIRGQRDLSNELKPQLLELTSALMRSQELTEEAQKAVARSDAAWRPEVQDLRSEAASHQKTLEQLEAEKNTLAKGLRELQRQGVSHEWRIPRLQQRVEYLSMDSKDSKGVWIDSPHFELEGSGPFVLRFYPRGVCGGDGLCAVGVFAPNRAGRTALPLRLELRISDLRKRASAQSEADGVLWLAHSFATLEALKDELLIGVDIPPFAWSALERSTSRPKEYGLTGAVAVNPFCKTPLQATGNELSSWHGSRLPVSACPVDREGSISIPIARSQTPKEANVAASGSATSEGHRSVPNSPHGSSASRPGWAAFGGEEVPKRPFSAHVPRSSVSQPMPVLLGSVHRKGGPLNSAASGAAPGRSSNPFANDRNVDVPKCGNPFDK